MDQPANKHGSADGGAHAFCLTRITGTDKELARAQESTRPLEHQSRHSRNEALTAEGENLRWYHQKAEPPLV